MIQNIERVCLCVYISSSSCIGDSLACPLGMLHVKVTHGSLFRFSSSTPVSLADRLNDRCGFAAPCALVVRFKAEWGRLENIQQDGLEYLEELGETDEDGTGNDGT